MSFDYGHPSRMQKFNASNVRHLPQVYMAFCSVGLLPDRRRVDGDYVSDEKYFSALDHEDRAAMLEQRISYGADVSF